MSFQSIDQYILPLRLIAFTLNCLLVLPTIFTFLRHVGRRRKRKIVDGPDHYKAKSYEDQDGVAVVADGEGPSSSNFSANVPVHLALVSAVVGLGVEVAKVALPKSSASMTLEFWPGLVCWIVLFIQTVHIRLLQNPIKRFKFGLLASSSAVVLFVALLAEDGFQAGRRRTQTCTLLLGLDIVQICAALILSLACFSIPRRPAVTCQGSAVDEQYTVSALQRYTFAWADPLLKLATTIPEINFEHIPLLHLGLRSRFLESQFSQGKATDSLIKRLLLAHWVELTFQFFFAIAMSILNFGPDLVMFGLLRLLERTERDADFYKSAAVLVLALGATILLSVWTEAWNHWIVYSRLGLPIRSELSAAIFTKAMRRKDVKGVAETGDVDAAGVKSTAASESSGDDDDSGGLQKTRQATINLVGVDAERIEDFATYWYIVPGTIAELSVGITFLIKLLGWKSLLSGFLIFCLVIPLNWIASKAFTTAEDDLMKIRDRKLVLVTEALHGIRQIKFSAQESQWQKRIGSVRKSELATQWRVFWLDSCLIAFWILGPVILGAISLSMHAYLTGTLSASVAFTSISVFSQLEMSMAVIPEMITDGIEALVSIRRIQEYLRLPERTVIAQTAKDIGFENATLTWPADEDFSGEAFALRDLNFTFPPKKLTVVSGNTGSGKSLLLSALIGEADLISGRMSFPEPPSYDETHDPRANKLNWIMDSAVAYVAQSPWIENATIRENVLFGLPFDHKRYENVLRTCALEKDLEILPDGDETDIGANGINLSGGQRWRVSFARALYSRAGILILDDIFSAVDAHVGRQLYEDALTGDLGQGRTRILVTHHLGLTLPRAEFAVVLNNGRVEHAGLVKDLQREGVFDESSVPVQTHEQDTDKTTKLPRQSFSSHAADDLDRLSLRKTMSHASQKSWKVNAGEVSKAPPKKFVEDEKREKGAVKLTVYTKYLKACGGLRIWVPIGALFLVYEAVVLSRSYFITAWTRSYKTSEAGAARFRGLQYNTLQFIPQTQSTDSPERDLAFWIGIYFALCVAICLMGTLRFLSIYVASLKASRELFDGLLYAVLRAPLRWLDTVPIGRILNRMTADFNMIDSDIGGDASFMFYQMITLIGVIVAGLFVSPWMLLAALLLLIVCGWNTRLFLNGARQVKRLDSNAKTPIFEQFGSALTGLGTIRSFGKSEEYVGRMFDMIDAHARTSWYLWLFNRWIIWRLSIVGAVFALVVTTVIVVSGIDASIAGFAISFALQYSSALIWAAKEYSNVELSMNAVERVAEYSNMAVEDQSEGDPVPTAWPTEGRVEVDRLVVGYAPDLPPVLRNLTFSIEKNQRVGVVGRTGAGKSSLTLALFRFLEARSGSIRIDGIDISRISLATLRSRLAIIPQDPVLFSGTVRSNLDPFDEHAETDLLDALKRVHLISESRPSSSRGEPVDDHQDTQADTKDDADGATNQALTLSSPIAESGLNLSQGQRQLLTLARAIVSRPKVLVMDEATSAVDMATDTLIQQSIRQEFQDATLIVIAHRLSTIADFDRVLVMDAGEAAEWGSPEELCKRGQETGKGIFWGMVEGSGEVKRLKEIMGVL